MVLLGLIIEKLSYFINSTLLRNPQTYVRFQDIHIKDLQTISPFSIENEV